MAGNGSFDERTDYLLEAVGEGYLTAKCTVDQPYAQDQHENLKYVHPNGQAKFLEEPLMKNAFELVAGVARAAITPDGSNLVDEMEEVAEKMAGYVLRYAPKDTLMLAESGHPTVEDNGTHVYNRFPGEPRRMTPSSSGWHRQDPGDN